MILSEKRTEKFRFFAQSHGYFGYGENFASCNGLPLITHDRRRDSRQKPREVSARRIAQLPDAVIPLRPACRSKSPMERGGFTFVNWHKKTEPRDRGDSRLDFFFSFVFFTAQEIDYRRIKVSSRGESVVRLEAYFRPESYFSFKRIPLIGTTNGSSKFFLSFASIVICFADIPTNSPPYTVFSMLSFCFVDTAVTFSLIARTNYSNELQEQTKKLYTLY